VAYPQGVDVREGAGELVEVELHVQQRQRHLGFLVLSAYGVHGLGDVLEDEVEV
jgi:hypothetical protein